MTDQNLLTGVISLLREHKAQWVTVDLPSKTQAILKAPLSPIELGGCMELTVFSSSWDYEDIGFMLYLVGTDYLPRRVAGRWVDKGDQPLTKDEVINSVLEVMPMIAKDK